MMDTNISTPFVSMSNIILLICITKEMNHNGHSEKFNCVEIFICSTASWFRHDLA